MEQIRIGAVSDKLCVARMDRAIKILRKKTDYKDIKRVIIHRDIRESHGSILINDIDLLLEELNSGNVDVIPLDLSDYIYYCRNTWNFDIEHTFAIAAYLERTAYGNILITRKRNMSNMPDAVIETDRVTRSFQLMDIYEGIKCENTKSGIYSAVGRVKKDECDGIVESLDAVKLLDLNRVHGLGYVTLDVTRMVPERGQGITVVITRKKSEFRKNLFKADSIKSRKEIEIENSIYNKVIFSSLNNEYGIEEESFCVCAIIDREKLYISVYIRVQEKGFRYKISGLYSDREHLVYNITNKINKIVDY